MHFERDVLHTVVVPELISRFSKRRINVDLVDLRWGIDVSDSSSETESSTKILKVCFDEIERSKPLFIGFIGERYGWIPNLSHVEKESLDANFDNFKGDESVTAMEMLYALEKFDSSDGCLFFIRNGLKPEDIKDEKHRKIYFPLDAPDEKCNKLKSLLRENYKDSTFDYNCYWDNDTQSIKGLDDLCNLIIEKLSDLIEREIDKTESKNDTVLLNEKRIQQSVLDDVATSSFGRENETKALFDFVENSPKKELIVSGVSGLGKSSLMALFCKKYQDALVIPFFTGISAQSKAFSFLPRYVYSILTNDTSDDVLRLSYTEIKRRLITALTAHSKDKKIIIVVDALDQFIPCKELYELDWINDQLLPDNVKIIYSALPEVVSHVKKRDFDTYKLDYLSDEDVVKVAKGVALRLHKELGEDALSSLVNKRDVNGNKISNDPLYLILLLELLCLFDHDDFVEISAIQETEKLSPSTAIQTYLARSIRSAGEGVSNILTEICKKSIQQLGKKYDVITALLTSNDNGMSEKEIIGITAFSDTPVNTVDFSLYRRMFRLHLVQRENGNWDFSHAKIKKEQKKYVDGLDKKDLYESAVKYYLSLPDNDPKKDAGLISFYSMLKRYRDVVLRMLNGKAPESTLKALIDCGAWPVLDACSHDEVISLSKIALDQAKKFSDAGVEELLTVFISFIKKIVSIDANSNVLTLSDLYEYCGLMLFENRDQRAQSFYEISLNILLKMGVERDVCIEKALEACRHFEVLEKFDFAEKCAKIAYDYARHGDDRLYIESCVKLCQIIEKNPLSRRKLLRGKYLSLAIKKINGLDFNKLGFLCAIEYKKLSKILRNSKTDELASKIIENTSDDVLDSTSLINKYLYQAKKDGDVRFYEKAYSLALDILVEDSSLDSNTLYLDVLEKYLYRLISDGKDKAKTNKILLKLCAVCDKLYLMTGDVSFVDKKIISVGNYERCFGQSDDCKEINVQSKKQIDKEFGDKRTSSVRKKDVYVGLMFKILLFVFVVVAFIGLLDFRHGNILSTSDVLLITLYLISDLIQAVINVLVGVAIFFALLLLFAPSKETFDYRTDKKIFKRLAFLILVLYVGLFFLTVYVTAKNYAYPISAFRLIQGTLILSFVYSSALTYFLAYAMIVLIRKPFDKGDENKARYKYNAKAMTVRHLILLGATLLSFIIFIPMWNFTPKIDVPAVLDYFGVTPSGYAKVCYLPFVLQGVLCLIERLFVRRNFKSFDLVCKKRTVKTKLRIKPVVKIVAITIASLIGFISMLACGQEIAIITYAEKENYGYDKGYVYGANAYTGLFEIAYYYGYKNDVVIPNVLDGYVIYGISNFPIDRIKSVVITDGIKSIGTGAFCDSEKLTKVVIPKSIDHIGSEAFKGCRLLEFIIFDGTMEQFGSIEKGRNWADDVLASVVTCIDGNVQI